MADWQLDARCNGVPTDLFFPSMGTSSNAIELKMIFKMCGDCPVREQCLEAALAMEGDCGRNMRHGLWGGTTPEQRHRMVKSRRVSRVRDDNLCPKGLHEMTDDNVYVHPASQYRECRECRRAIRERHRINRRRLRRVS